MLRYMGGVTECCQNLLVGKSIRFLNSLKAFTSSQCSYYSGHIYACSGKARLPKPDTRIH
jgi:hypothetical protein